MASKMFPEDATFETTSAFLNEFDFSTATSASLDKMLAYHQSDSFQPTEATVMASHLNNDINFNLDRLHRRFDSGNNQLPQLQTNMGYDTGYASQETTPIKSPNVKSTFVVGVDPTNILIQQDVVSKPRKPRKNTPSETSKSVAIETKRRDEKRRNLLQRNRQAADRCRQKKRIWTKGLEERMHELATERQLLATDVAILKNELLILKSKCLEHWNCHCEQIRDYLKQMVPPQGHKAVYYEHD
jgi:hypothetical protein